MELIIGFYRWFTAWLKQISHALFFWGLIPMLFWATCKLTHLEVGINLDRFAQVGMLIDMFAIFVLGWEAYQHARVPIALDGRLWWDFFAWLKQISHALFFWGLIPMLLWATCKLTHLEIGVNLDRFGQVGMLVDMLAIFVLGWDAYQKAGKKQPLQESQ